MAEILKITTPLVNKNSQVNQNKPVADPTVPFHLQDIPTVTKTVTSGEILKQNTGLIQRENADTVLTNLLKDPAAAVSFMKNIYVLQEIIKLLPVNNSTVTQEIEQMFNALLLNPDDIAAEMARQEGTSTIFRGELFNFLRGLVTRGNASPEMLGGVANLLKAINSLIGRQDALDAVANSLQYLSESLSPSKALSEKLAKLSQEFRGQDAQERSAQLKTQAQALLKEVENSILFSPKLDKINSITLYNLSRYNDNPDFFKEAVSNLLLLLDGQSRREFASLIQSFRDGLQTFAQRGEASKIMEMLTKIIGRQAEEGASSAAIAERVEKIIYSLLSSPCHFTPLLHFVVPVEFMDLKSFAEIWINPNGQEDLRGRETDQECSHMLLVFDIQGIGQFEVELYVIGKEIQLSVLCPPAYALVFSRKAEQIAKCVNGTSYQVREIRVDKLERPRSLMEVFKSLPYKRTGVDVKV